MTEQIHLVVATPCFGGQVSTLYVNSIFALQRAVRSLSNVRLKIELRDGDALITRARANLMTSFLDDPTATHLLFIDADIGFTPDQVFRLIESAADVVAGVYPIKRVNWEKAQRAFAAGRPNVPAASLDYVLEINDPDHVAVVNGFTRVRYAGTGFLMIRRGALEKMCANFGARGRFCAEQTRCCRIKVEDPAGPIEENEVSQDVSPPVGIRYIEANPVARQRQQ